MSSSPTSSSSSDAAVLDATPEPLLPLFDVACVVDFILGTGTLKVRHCVGLTERSVVRLEQPAGADIEIRVHGQSVAHGEVVVVDDSMALRVNRLVSLAGDRER